VSRPRAGTAAAPLPRARKKAPARRPPFPLPSPKSVAVGLGLIALAAGLYGIGRTTSAFAVRDVQVTGAPPAVRRQVQTAVARLHGTSLLALDGHALERTLAALPSVVSGGYDRAFPHTLRIEVVPETPVAVVRQGAKAWVVSARGRVIAVAAPHAQPSLTRVWVPRTTPVVVGGFLPAKHATAIARALALTLRFPAHIVRAALRRDGLHFYLRDGLELRLGEPTDVRLKLAIVRQAIGRLPVGTTYLDVAVPGRPVAGNSQVSGRD
jgi:cell division protein FtsQ